MTDQPEQQRGKALNRYGKAAQQRGARQTGETVNRQQRTANGERTAYISRFRRRAAPPDMSAVTNPGTNPPQCAPKCRFPRGGDPIPVGFSKNQKSPAHRTRTVFRCRTVFCLTLRTYPLSVLKLSSFQASICTTARYRACRRPPSASPRGDRQVRTAGLL